MFRVESGVKFSKPRDMEGGGGFSFFSTAELRGVNF